jgi:hypothetical protein
MEGISISVARKSLDLETVELASIPLPRVEGQAGRITRHWSASKKENVKKTNAYSAKYYTI